MFLNRIFKPKTHVRGHRNKALAQFMTELEYEPHRMRKALLAANGIRIRKLLNGTCASLVYGTIRGDRKHRPVMERMAEQLDIPVDELFPERGGIPGKGKSDQAAT